VFWISFLIRLFSAPTFVNVIQFFSLSGTMFLSLLFTMFLIHRLYWFFYVPDYFKFFNIFFGFMFYELVIITRYLIPSCLCSAKWHELSGMI